MVILVEGPFVPAYVSGEWERVALREEKPMYTAVKCQVFFFFANSFVKTDCTKRAEVVEYIFHHNREKPKFCWSLCANYKVSSYKKIAPRAY